MNRRLFLLAAPAIVLAPSLMRVSVLDPAWLAVWQPTPSGMDYRFHRSREGICVNEWRWPGQPGWANVQCMAEVGKLLPLDHPAYPKAFVEQRVRELSSGRTYGPF